MITLIAAIGQNNEIGAKNQLVWKNSIDMQHFRSLTLGKAVLMGRLTFESIGKPLPGRTNIVVSSNPIYGVISCSSLNTALLMEDAFDELFIIGGESIYKSTIGIADRLHITHINKSFEDADKFFPKLSLTGWVLDCKINHDEFSFATYVRK